MVEAISAEFHALKSSRTVALASYLLAETDWVQMGFQTKVQCK